MTMRDDGFYDNDDVFFSSFKEKHDVMLMIAVYVSGNKKKCSSNCNRID